MPGPVPGTHAAPRPHRSRRGPQPSGALCGPVRRGWPGQARPGRRVTVRGRASRFPASCPGLSRAPTPRRGRTGPGAGRSRPAHPAERAGVGGRDKPSHDGGTMRGMSLALSRVMPGPVPGTHAVPRPDRSRRGPQPFGAHCGTGRRGWPGQARPGRWNHERGRVSRSPASCPGPSRAPTPCRGRTGPGGGRSHPVRSAARSGVGGRDKPGQDGGTMRWTSRREDCRGCAAAAMRRHRDAPTSPRGGDRRRHDGRPAMLPPSRCPL